MVQRGQIQPPGMNRGGAGAQICLTMDVPLSAIALLRTVSIYPQIWRMKTSFLDLLRSLPLPPQRTLFNHTPPSVFHTFFLGQSSGSVGDTSEFCSETQGAWNDQGLGCLWWGTEQLALSVPEACPQTPTLSCSIPLPQQA